MSVPLSSTVKPLGLSLVPGTPMEENSLPPMNMVGGWSCLFSDNKLVTLRTYGILTRGSRVGRGRAQSPGLGAGRRARSLPTLLT